MIKKLLIVALLLLLPSVPAHAAPISWDGNFGTQVLQPLQSMWAALVKANRFQATSTTQASTFPYASTTALTTSGTLYSNGNTTLGDASGDTITLNAATMTLASNVYNINKNLFPAPAASTIVLNYNLNASADSGGTSEVWMRHEDMEIGGSNPFADVRNAYIGITSTSTATTDLLYNLHTYIINDGPATITDANGVFNHVNARVAGAYIHRACNFCAGTSVLTNGGAVGTIKGLSISNLGASGVAGNVYGVFVSDTSATSTVNAFYSETTAGTGKHALWMNGTATNLLVGKTRIGATTEPVTTLDVTGTASFTSFVGIGTTTATDLLTLAGSSGATSTIARNDNGNTAGEPLGTLAWWSNDATANGSGYKTYIRGMTENAAGTVYGLWFGTSNAGSATDRMVLSGAGNLGIGTTAPAVLLDVSGSQSGTTLTTIGQGIRTALMNTDTTNNNFSALTFRTVDTNGVSSSTSMWAGVHTSHTASAVSGDLVAYTNNAGSFTEKIIIKADGRVGVGTTSPFRTFSVVGTMANTGMTAATGGTNQDICITATGDFVNESTGTCIVSSRKFKHDIRELDVSALDLIKGLKPSSFVRNGEELTRYGFIAEEVAETDEHLASYGLDGEPRGLDEHALIAIAIKGIQEQQEQIDELMATGPEGNKNRVEDVLQWMALILIGCAYILNQKKRVGIGRTDSGQKG